MSCIFTSDYVMCRLSVHSFLVTFSLCDFPSVSAYVLYLHLRLCYVPVKCAFVPCHILAMRCRSIRLQG
nr:MAG TPA: hypothetical protein [Caudoviricetes sp.]